jgi:hypothetical protein
VVFRPTPPRRLPPQDHPALDQAERAARRVTWAVAGLAGLVLLSVLCGLLSGPVSARLASLLGAG